MREYEVVYILKGNIEGEPADKIQEKVRGLVERQGGTVIGLQYLGKKALAYPIEKETRGNYYLLRFVSGGAVVSDLERFFKLSEDVIRFLTIRLADEVDPIKRKEEFAQAMAKAAEMMNKAETKGESDETTRE